MRGNEQPQIGMKARLHSNYEGGGQDRLSC